MRLSLEKDLLLIIIISLAVLIISRLHFLNSSTLTPLYIVILLMLVYALITTIWPTNVRISQNMRLGISFAIGLFFLLLILILEYLNFKFVTTTFTNLLLLSAIILSLWGMLRQSKLGGETQERGSQLTLEESVERLKNITQTAENSEFENHKDQENPSETTKEEPADAKEDFGDSDEEPDKYDHLKEEEKPIQYARVHRKDYINIKPNSAHHYMNKPVTDPSLKEYEAMMYKPVWMDESLEKKASFKFWDILFIIIVNSVSLLFLYFNPQSSSTSIIFSVLLLFITGYAFLTIIFPDKSRVSLRKLITISGIIAITLFFLSFMVGASHLLPFTPQYIIPIMLVSIILLAGAVLQKWQSTKKKPKDDIGDERSPNNKYKEITNIKKIKNFLNQKRT